MSRPTPVGVIRDFIRAKHRFNAAREALLDSLPEDVQTDLHYNGRHAQVPKKYMKAVKLLRGDTT